MTAGFSFAGASGTTGCGACTKMDFFLAFRVSPVGGDGSAESRPGSSAEKRMCASVDRLPPSSAEGRAFSDVDSRSSGTAISSADSRLKSGSAQKMDILADACLEACLSGAWLSVEEPANSEASVSAVPDLRHTHGARDEQCT